MFVEFFFTNLVVLIEPEKCQIGHADWLPVVLNLLARAVDDVSDFVSYDKLQILQQIIVPSFMGTPPRYIRIQIKAVYYMT